MGSSNTRQLPETVVSKEEKEGAGGTGQLLVGDS